MCQNKQYSGCILFILQASPNMKERYALKIVDPTVQHPSVE